jgi:two-component system sensor histidine kinase PilS (NtrC family)
MPLRPLLLYSSGGVSSGLGMLLVIPVGAVSLLLRRPFVIAAAAAILLLAQQVAVSLAGLVTVADYTAAGVLGAILFIIALGAMPLADRIRETEELVRQRDVDLANLAELSQYIVQHLRESILVVDAGDRIRLINESAAEILGDRSAIPGALLVVSRACSIFCRHGGRAEHSPGQASFVCRRYCMVRPPPPSRWPESPDGAGFLEGPSAGRDRAADQTAALVPDASIAHEIHNPVGAIVTLLLAVAAWRR